MLFFLFSLAHSYFLSPQFDRTLKVDPAQNAEEIFEKVKNTNITFLLCGESGEGNLAQTYIALKEIFPDFQFLYTEEKPFNEVYAKEKMTPPVLPALVVFESGVITTAISQITDPNQLSFLVDLYGNHKTPIIKTVTSFNIPQVIGLTPITIITTPENFSKAFKLAQRQSYYLGPISISLITKEALQETNFFDHKSPSVFRSTDGHVQSFDLRSTRSFTAAATPYFHYGTLHDLKHQRKDIFAFYAPLCQSYLKELLIAVGQQLKPLGFVTYFVSSSAAAREIREITNGFEIAKNGMGYAIFNEHYNYFYNVSQFQPPQQITSAQAWANLISKAIGGYQDKTIKPEFRTEKTINITNTTSDTFIRLSAHNYKVFQNLEGIDSLIIYLKASVPECIEYFPDYYDLAEEVRDRGFGSQFKFAYIDIGKNGLPENLPDDSQLPFVEFYPANNKSNPVRSYVNRPKANDIIMLMKAYASSYFPVAAEIPPKDEFLKFKNDLNKNMTRLTLKERNKASDFLAKMEEMYGTKNSYFARDVWSKNDLKSILQEEKNHSSEL